MSIHRINRAPYGQVSNQAMRDKQLSYKARGILAMVLGHAEDWDATRSWLETQSTHDGREAVQNALNELTALGYRHVHKTQLPDGTWTTIVEWFQHSTGSPVDRTSAKPSVGEPVGNRTPSTEDHTEEDKLGRGAKK